MRSYLVVGGGIAGLAAAEALSAADPTARVTVLEGGDRVGGKLRGEQVAGRWVDVGAEATLARRPEAVDLAGLAGLGARLTHPTAAGAQVWSRGRLHPLPQRTFLGVPADPETLRGLLTDTEVARARSEQVHITTERDTSVADLVSSRLGPAVTQRLVEPLLGGVYAGHASLLSAAAAVPALLAAARAGEPLTRAVQDLLPAADRGTQVAAPAGPVFAGLVGGMHQLPAALARTLTGRGVQIRTGTLVRELRALPGGGYAVVSGPRTAPVTDQADAVVLAVPVAAAARLLTGPAPAAAAELAGVQSASVAVVTLALPARATGELDGSGFLVPPVEGRTVKASTFSATKWDWVRELGEGAGPDRADVTFLRASVGRHREEESLQVDDAALARAALADLGAALDRELPAPVDAHVQRWGGGLPQYAVGHPDRVARLREALGEVPGLAVCGAYLDGVGVPACIASARRGVARLLG